METETNAVFPTAHITPQLVEQVRNQFVGEIQQYPPVFSALKKDGKRLYEFAREGKEVDVEARKVSIYDLKLDFISSNELSFEVHCSKGTYIRSLANDIGKALQSGGYLSYLRRTKIGDFSVENALSPEDFVKKYIEIE